jgi:hypothetical protein
MHRITKSLFAVASFAMPLTVTLAQPAAAANVDVAVIQGSGTISPGLTEVVQAQSVNFTGTATVVGTDGVLATYDCSFAGSGFGNAAGGVGNVSGACGPAVFPSCTFAFTAVHVTVACAPTAAAADCVFTPNNVRPTTSYGLVCEGFVALP